MLSIIHSSVPQALNRVSYSLRVKAAGVFARRALHQLAHTAPWQEISMDAEVRIRIRGKIEDICAKAGRRFNVSGEAVIAAMPEVSLLRTLMTEHMKSQPVVLPVAFVFIR